MRWYIYLCVCVCVCVSVYKQNHTLFPEHILVPERNSEIHLNLRHLFQYLISPLNVTLKTHRGMINLVSQLSNRSTLFLCYCPG